MKPCYRGNDECPDDCCEHLRPDPLEQTQDIYNADGNGVWRRASKRLWVLVRHAAGGVCDSADPNNPYCDICGDSGR